VAKLNTLERIGVNIGFAVRLWHMMDDSSNTESRWVLRFSNFEQGSTISNPNGESLEDFLVLQGHLAGVISNLSDFPSWYTFRQEAKLRRFGMATMSICLKYTFIPYLAYAVFINPTEHNIRVLPEFIFWFSSILTSEAALLNPLQASIPPSKILQPTSSWARRIFARAGDYYLMSLDLWVFSMTWVTPI
jgi:hypothetical protein